MLWPWGLRAQCVTFKLGQKPAIQDNQVPTLRKWRKSLFQDSAVQDTLIPIEQYWQCIKTILRGEIYPCSKLDEYV